MAPAAEVVAAVAPRTREEHRIVGGRLPDLVPFKPQRLEEGRPKAGRWAKGSSGNPEGARLSVVNYIRTMSANGLEMATHAFRCMRGSMVIQRMDPSTGVVQEALVPSNGKEQGDAREYLRAQGLIDELQEVGGQVVQNFAAFTPDEMRDYLRLQRKLEAPALPEGEAEAELVSG